MDHRRHIKLYHLFVQRIPVTIAQRRILPVAAGWIGVQVAADEAVLQHAALQLGDAILRRYAGGLWQHADTDKVTRKQCTDAVDQLVACGSPRLTGGRIAQMVSHAGGTRRADRKIGSAFLLQLQLAAHDAGADLVVADSGARWCRLALRVCRNLLGAPGLVLARRRGVMPMAVDDHGSSQMSLSG